MPDFGEVKAFLARRPWRLIAIVALVLAVLGLLQLRSCERSNQQAAQAKVDRGQMEALANSAAEAVNTIGAVGANTLSSAELGRQNEEEIRHAKGSDQRVDPAANAAGLRALCRRASHRDDPACRVQQPGPR